MTIKKRPDESIDSLIRRFKKDTLKSEVLKDLRKKEFYMSPSEKRRVKRAEAAKRCKKSQAKAKMY